MMSLTGYTCTMPHPGSDRYGVLSVVGILLKHSFQRISVGFVRV